MTIHSGDIYENQDQEDVAFFHQDGGAAGGEAAPKLPPDSQDPAPLRLLPPAWGECHPPGAGSGPRPDRTTGGVINL